VKNRLSVAPYYEGWRVTNDRLVQTIGALSAEHLELAAAPNLWPIWATTAHVAGARVYWLCTVFKEPGAEHTPFADPAADGWEDDLSHPRRSDELVIRRDAGFLVTFRSVHLPMARRAPTRESGTSGFAALRKRRG